MHRIDGPGATEDNKFTDGNPTTGVPATVVTAGFLNSVQEEICTVIEAAGLELDEEDNTQLNAAIDAKIAAAGGGGGGGGGEANTASNLGTGEGQVYKQKIGVDLQMRTLRAGTGVSIVNGTNEITISATGTGEANTASNIGTGTGIYASKSGVDLRFKSIAAGTGVSIADNGSTVTISATGGGGGVTDHGTLTGLSDDDHTQYFNQARGDARYLQRGSNLSDLTNAATARSNLGLGTAATANTGTGSSDVPTTAQADGRYAKLTGATFTGPVSYPSSNTTSSRRYKTDIADITPEQALELIAGLRIVSYRMRTDGSRAAGVIAEELADGPLDFCVTRTAGGEPEAVNYQPLFAIAVAALQGLAARVAALEAR